MITVPDLHSVGSQCLDESHANNVLSSVFKHYVVMLFVVRHFRKRLNGLVAIFVSCASNDPTAIAFNRLPSI